MDQFSWGSFIGGVAFFFFGLHAVREGLQLVAGDSLRAWLLRLTGNRFSAFGFGALMTLILQSSSATSALLVSLADAQLLTLRQAFAVILGADVGATAVVFLLAAQQITGYALGAIAIGFALQLWAKHPRWRYIGQFTAGFGLVFYGITLTVQSMQPLRDSPLVADLFVYLADRPFWSLMCGAVLTGLVRSSAATLGLALSLAYAGVLTLEGALPLVLGANVGTTISAVMAAMNADLNARRVAGAHTLSKLLMALITFPLMGVAAQALTWLTTQTALLHGPFKSVLALQIALAHLGFNVLLALLFLPCLPIGVWLVCRILPEKPGGEERFGPKHLDPRALETPALAFAQASREVFRIANLSNDLFKRMIDLFRREVDFLTVADEMQAIEDKIDCLEKAVRFYLARLTQHSLTEEQARTQIILLGLAADLEDIGDVVTKDIMVLARKRYERRQNFSDTGWRELLAFHTEVDHFYTLVMAFMTSHDQALISQARISSVRLKDMEGEYRMAHLRRLGEGLRESVETSSIHLDLLTCMRRIANKLAHVAKATEGLR